MNRLLALLIDVALVLAFATTGRASHDEGISVVGVLETAWPFLVGLLAGWLMLAMTQWPVLSWRSGVAVWLCTLVGGMALRILTDAGTALPFVVVATLVTGVLLVGWRLVRSAATQGGRASAR